MSHENETGETGVQNKKSVHNNGLRYISRMFRKSDICSKIDLALLTLLIRQNSTEVMEEIPASETTIGQKNKINRR